jgi:hypothetical protein
MDRIYEKVYANLKKTREIKIHQAKWNTVSGKYFNKHFKQETIEHGFNEKTIKEVKYLIFQSYNNCKIYKISQIPTYL